MRNFIGNAKERQDLPEMKKLQGTIICLSNTILSEIKCSNNRVVHNGTFFEFNAKWDLLPKILSAEIFCLLKSKTHQINTNLMLRGVSGFRSHTEHCFIVQL